MHERHVTALLALVALSLVATGCGSSGSQAAEGMPRTDGATHGLDGGSSPTDATTARMDAKAPGADGASSRRDGGGTPEGGLVVPPLPPLPAGVATGKTYYVSPSGDDSLTGMSPSTAWKTLTKVTSTTFGPGDTVLLEGGATFAGCPTFTSANVTSTKEAPFTLGSYGTGTFTIDANCTGTQAAAITIEGVNGFYLHDCSLRGNSGGAEYGVFIWNPGTTTTSFVRVEQCDISGFYTPSTSGYGGEIFIAGSPGKLDTIQLLNNVLHGSSGPTSPDDNGITGYGTKGNITNVLYQGNLVYDVGSKVGGPGGSSGNCILTIAVDGGLVQYNVVHGCGGNTSTCGGPAGVWTYGSNDVTIQYNEAYDIKPAGATPAGACDWDGYDLDGNVTNSTLQYNYSHDNFGVGLLSFINQTWSGNTIRYNISQNDGEGIALGGSDGTTSDLAIYGNTIYSASDAGVSFQVGAGGGGSFGGHVLDNVFFLSGGGHVIDVESWNTAAVTGLRFVGNDYYAPNGFEVAWGPRATPRSRPGAQPPATRRSMAEPWASRSTPSSSRRAVAGR